MRRASVRPAPHGDGVPRGTGWYRQPVVWLAVAVLTGSLAAVAATIVVAQRFADEPLPVAGERILKTPVTRPAEPAAPATKDRAE
jgi:hypothetical protein